jgi:hypothetical protein
MDEENGNFDAENQGNDSEQKFKDQQKRAELAEAEAKALKEQLEALTKQPDLPEKVTTTFDDLADNLAVLKPLENDEVEELRKQAKELGVDPIKFAQSPAWKAQLEVIKANRKAEDSTPSPSFRTAVFEGKSFEQIIKDENSSPETRQAAFIAQRDALLKRGVNHSI